MRLFCFVMLTLYSLAPRAEVLLEVNQGTVQPIQMAILAPTSSDAAGQSLGQQIAQVVQNDLSSTGLFSFVDPRAFIERKVAINTPPLFANWRLLKAQALINMGVEMASSGMIQLKLRLWDIFTEEALLSASLETQKKYWRRTAHAVADAIYKKMTGEEGYFDTRIVYVTEEGVGTKQKKRLAIMDQDGANHRYLTDGKSLVLTPRFAKNLQTLTYLSYEKRVPKVFLLDLETGRHDLLGSFPGMTFAPRFSPDGSQIIMSQATNGRSVIVEMDLKTRRTKQLTNTPFIDTSPCFDPKAEFIAFTSDRSGKPQIYVMKANGSDQKRISFGKGSYSTPVWSPRGDYIAFTKQQGGQFYIGVMKPDGSGERLITSGYLVEGPTWAPNGRTLMYTRQDPPTPGRRGKSRLYAIDVTGDHDRQVKTPQDASDPAWSGLLPTQR